MKKRYIIIMAWLNNKREARVSLWMERAPELELPAAMDYAKKHGLKMYAMEWSRDGVAAAMATAKFYFMKEALKRRAGR